MAVNFFLRIGVFYFYYIIFIIFVHNVKTRTVTNCCKQNKALNVRPCPSTKLSVLFRLTEIKDEFSKYKQRIITN